MTQGNRKKENPVSGLSEHHRFTVCRNESTSSSHLRSVAELSIGEMAGSYSVFPPLNQIFFKVRNWLFLLEVFWGRGWGRKCFSKIFHRCYSTIDKLS